jgi:hypothetical protein
MSLACPGFRLSRGWFVPARHAWCGKMTCCAAPACLSECDERVRVTAAAASAMLIGRLATENNVWGYQRIQPISWRVAEFCNSTRSVPEDRFEHIRLLIRDRGSNFTASFDAVFQAAGARMALTARPGPQMSATFEPSLAHLDSRPSRSAPSPMDRSAASAVIHMVMSSARRVGSNTVGRRNQDRQRRRRTRPLRGGQAVYRGQRRA